MRIPRKSLAASLTATLALGAAASASADGITDEVSQLSSSVNPSLQSADDAGKVSLFTQVTSLDKDNAPVIPAFPAEVVRIDFPAEMTWKANSKLDQCDHTLPAIATGSPDDAVNACADALVGSGHAIARFAAFPQENNETELTVSVFNGETSVAGEQDSTDQPTGGWDGGNPTIILHANNALAGTTLTRGEVRPSPTADTATEQFGTQLNVTDAPDVAADAGALVLFNAQVSRAYTNGKTGNKKKKYDLVSATCDDGGDNDWDFKGTWEYDDGTVDVDNNTNASLGTQGAQSCTEK